MLLINIGLPKIFEEFTLPAGFLTNIEIPEAFLSFLFCEKIEVDWLDIKPKTQFRRSGRRNGIGVFKLSVSYLFI